MNLHRVVAPFFVAGIVTDDRDLIVEAAPIVRYARGRTLPWFVRYASGRGWKVRQLDVLDLESVPGAAGPAGGVLRHRTTPAAAS